MHLSEQVDNVFAAEYPVAKSIKLSSISVSESTTEPEGFPHYIFMAIKAMEYSLISPKIVCMVFPKKDLIAPAIATAVALERYCTDMLPDLNLKNRQSHLAYLSPGNLVIVNPGSKCYVYEGIEKIIHHKTRLEEDHVVLSVIGEKNSRQGFNLKTFDTSRLSLYNRPAKIDRRMIGKLDDPCLKPTPKRIGLDLLLSSEYALYDNKSLIKPSCIIVSNSNTASDFFKSINLSRSDIKTKVKIEDSIRVSSGKLNNIPFQAGIIHAKNLEETQSFLDYHNKTDDAPTASKTLPVVIDGLKLVRDYEQLHQIIFGTNEQNDFKREVVIISEYSEIDVIKKYSEHFSFWQVINEEISK